MKVFLSWSGTKSRLIAETLHEWLPNVIQAVRPWLSASDIDKGARWSSDIALQLEETQFGIICLTPENLDAAWVLFEAGALSKTLEKTYVCPYLFAVEPAELKGPLVQFQAAKADKEDTRRLIQTMNQALGEGFLLENKIDKAFNVWWPELEAKLKSIPDIKEQQPPQRAERELLEEILDLVRNQTRNSLGISRELLEGPQEEIEAEILSLLKQEPKALTIVAIAKRIDATPYAVSRAVDNLRFKGLLGQGASSTIPRYKYIKEI